MEMYLIAYLIESTAGSPDDTAATGKCKREQAAMQKSFVWRLIHEPPAQCLLWQKRWPVKIRRRAAGGRAGE
jgi:hypothetical protein